MIRTISGTVTRTTTHSVVIEVHGFGIEVFVPERDLTTLNTGVSVTLSTHLALKEHAVDLYGFADTETLQLFELLLTVSGVGPRSALGIVNLASVETLRGAIAARDHSYLTRVAGVGKKMAEKIILELREKVGEGNGHTIHGTDTELFETLLALGYKEREAKQAIQNIPNTITNKEDRLKAALSKQI